jgi:hypothetical protein
MENSEVKNLMALYLKILVNFYLSIGLPGLRHQEHVEDRPGDVIEPEIRDIWSSL